MKILMLMLLPLLLLACVTEVETVDTGIPTVTTCGCDLMDNAVCDCGHDSKEACTCN